MAFSKRLFLAVYASNGLIRGLFLPICYVLITSPFLLLFIRQTGLYPTISNYVSDKYKTPDTWPQIFLALIAVSLATRVASGKTNVINKEGRKRRVQLLPYWFPWFRHWTNVVFGGEGWLKGVSESTVASIVGYNSAGAKHNVILSPQLLDQLLDDPKALKEDEEIRWAVLQNAFSAPNSAREQYDQLHPALSKMLEAELFHGSQMKKLVSASLSSLSQTLPDLITFNASMVDQMPWERVAGIELTDGTVEVECDLHNLINEFFSRSVIPLITGAQFPESYELLASDLSAFNQSFYLLALGLPRFFPVPGLPGASISRKRLVNNLTELFWNFSSPPVQKPTRDDASQSGDETDADTPTPLTALNQLFARNRVPIPARASITLEILHRIISEAVPLAFWVLLQIYSQSPPSQDKELAKNKNMTPLERIREETKAWAEAIQPPSIHPLFPAPPEITFSSPDQLFSLASFPYLRSCIREARRVYDASIATAIVTGPVTLVDSQSMRPGTEEKWELDLHSYVDIGISESLNNTSAAHHLVPTQFVPDRFINRPPPPKSSSFADQPQELTTALLIAFIAGITQLWDITAAPKKTIFDQMQEAQAAAAGQDPSQIANKEKKPGVWTIPKAVDGAGVKVPKADVRVRIRRREGLDESTTRRKGR